MTTILVLLCVIGGALAGFGLITLVKIVYGAIHTRLLVRREARNLDKDLEELFNQRG